MRQILIVGILILIISVNSNSQDLELSFLSDCALLREKGMLEEAQSCYMQHDTSVYATYEAAVISKHLQDSKSFKKLSKRLVSRKIGTPVSYSLCADLFTDDSNQCLRIIHKGLKVFKNDTILLERLTNFHLANENLFEALGSIDELIKYRLVHDKSIFYAKGAVYLQINDKINALKCFEKAISIDPEFFDAYYNIAVIYFNTAVDLYDQASDVSGHKEYERLYTLANDEFGKAIPFLIKADEVNPDDLGVLNALKTIYGKLDNNDAFFQIENRIAELQAVSR